MFGRNNRSGNDCLQLVCRNCREHCPLGRVERQANRFGCRGPLAQQQLPKLRIDRRLLDQYLDALGNGLAYLLFLVTSLSRMVGLVEFVPP